MLKSGKNFVKLNEYDNFVKIVLFSKLMSNTTDAIHLLEDKLKILLSKYEFLKEENKILFENNAKLHHLLHLREGELKVKQEEYDLLKIAKTIEGSNEDTKETKLKINALVREIDKCINLLHT